MVRKNPSITYTVPWASREQLTIAHGGSAKRLIFRTSARCLRSSSGCSSLFLVQCVRLQAKTAWRLFCVTQSSVSPLLRFSCCHCIDCASCVRNWVYVLGQLCVHPFVRSRLYKYRLSLVRKNSGCARISYVFVLKRSSTYVPVRCIIITIIIGYYCRVMLVAIGHQCISYV